MINKAFQENSKISGIVELRKFDTKRLEILKHAIKQGLPKRDLESLEKWASKPIFKANSLWRFFKKLFNVDLQISFIFGNWTKNPVIINTITDVGKKISADQVGGTLTAPVTAIAIGIGSPGTTALGSEITTNGGERGAASVTNQTTSTTGDTEQWIKTFSFTGTFAVTEEGLFNNNTSGGIMLASQSFSAINVVSGDSLQITHKVKYA